MTKQEAELAGLNKFNGSPCTKCGSTIRYVIDHNCVDCKVEKARIGRQLSKDHIQVAIKNVDWEQQAHNLALALECMLFDENRFRQTAWETLEHYRKVKQQVYPEPPTFMEEPI